MKTFTASTVALFLASLASALPTNSDTTTLAKRSCSGPQVTIAFSNEMSGAWVPTTVCMDNVAVGLPTLLAGTALDKNGQYLASSMSLTSGLANNPLCTVQSAAGAPFGQLTAQTTYYKFGTNANQLQLIDLADKRVQCTVLA